MNFRVYNLEKKEVSQVYSLEEVLVSGVRLAKNKHALIVMLGTGEFDTSGKEIFEGDFAKNELGEHGCISYSNGEFWLGYFDEPAKQALSTFKEHGKNTTLTLTGIIRSFINEQYRYDKK